MATNDNDESGGADCIATLFARTLKSIGSAPYTKNDGTSIMLEGVIIGFDFQKFTDKCHSNSPNYDPSLCNFDAISLELFKEGEVWLNRDMLKKAMDVLSKLQGWSTRIDKRYLQCNRFGTDNTKRGYASGGLKGDCTFRIKLVPLVNVQKRNQNESSRNNFTYTPDWNGLTKIGDACCEHGGACNPGKQNLIAVLDRSGKYTETMPQNTLFLLCNYAEDGKLSTSIIKKTLAKVWPRNKVITKSNVFNVRVKVKRLMKTFKDTNGDYEEFKQFINQSDLLCGIDDEVSIDDDEAYELAQSLWEEVMSEVENKDEVLFSFIDYLELIAVRAKGFVYRLAEDEGAKDSGRKKLIGVIWQTATMRRNFELFGDVIGLDMMKRGLNKFLWPYAGVAMYDEMKRLCIACEGVLCGERADMYRFIADFLAESTPKRTLADVKIVAADAFFTQEMIENLGFINATFILDRWHLLDSGLEKMFGKAGYQKLERYLVEMVKSESIDQFESYHAKAQQHLQAMQVRDGDLEAKLEAFVGRRKSYASFAIASIPGNRGILGNANSEQNHSSLLAYVNNGKKGGNDYCEDIGTLIKDLLRRDNWKRKKTNKELFARDQKMTIERERLRNEIQTVTNLDLLAASNELNHDAYERYKSERLRADRDLELHVFVDPSTQESITEVRNTKYPDSHPRIFRCATDRCKCNTRLKEEDMCAHEIKARGGYRSSLFKPYHFARKMVTGSLEGWTEPNADVVDELIGYEEVVSQRTEDDPDKCFEIEDGLEGAITTTTAITTTKVTSSNTTHQPGPSVALPKDDFPEKGGKCKPLQSTVVKSIFNIACESYARLDEDKKFEISALALKLQDLLTETPKSAAVASRGGDYFVMKPHQSSVACQPKTRLKPNHEQQANRSSKKLNKSIQNLGMKQTVVLNEAYEVEVNGKKKRGGCQFCNEGHAYTNCPRRVKLKMISTEYLLSTNSSDQQKMLRDRIRMTMPTERLEGGIPSYHDTLENKQYRSNFIIHRACAAGDDCYIYEVSFLANYAHEGDKIWISHDAMNAIITHNLVRIKFVYDKTSGGTDGVRHSDPAPHPVENSLLNLKSSSSDDEDNITLAQLGTLANNESVKRKSYPTSNIGEGDFDNLEEDADCSIQKKKKKSGK